MFDFTKEELISALNSNPKDEAVKVSESKIQAIKENPMLSEAFKSLDKAIEYYKDKPLYAIPFSLFKRFELDGDRTDYEYAEQGYFARRGHLVTWALASLFYGNEEYLSKLEDTVWAICDEYTWALPAHMHGDQGIYKNYQPDRFTIDLFAAETGQALAETLQLVGEKLNPLVIQRAKREIKTRILDRYLYGDLSDFSWARSVNNWAAVCAGSVGMAAICEMEDNELLAEVILKNLASMTTFISGFSEDGACLEGTGYWSYGFGYFAAYADMLYRRTGGQIDLFNNERVKNVALFPTKTFFYGSRTISFSDSSSRGSMGIGLVSMLKKHYPELIVPAGAKLGAGVQTSGCHRFSSNFRGFLWADSTPPQASETLNIYPFPHAQWYIANGADNFGFAAKAGTNAEPHNHNDVGHFITFKNGTEFFCDLGSGEYNKQYFGRERYTFPHCGSQGHSVPIINGQYQCAGAKFAAKDVSVDENGIKMDMSGVYSVPSLTSLIRDYTFNAKKATVEFSDTFTFSELPNQITERFVTKICPELSEGKATLTSKDGTSMSLYYDRDLLSAEVTEMVQPDHGGNPFTFYYIDLTLKQMQKDITLTFTVK